MGEFGIEQGDGGYGEDAILIAVSPIFFQPEVEAAKHLACGFGIALEGLLQATPNAENNSVAPTPCSSITSNRRSRSWYSGRIGLEIAKCFS